MSRIQIVDDLLTKYGQNDQRTDAWHTKRGQMLTASEIYKALPEATPAQRYELIMSKLTPRTPSNGPGARALIWGTRFEPIAKQIYCELQFNIQIYDTTCVPHPKVSFLGASPDGVIVTDDKTDFRFGKLVEFKCPISREFTEHTPIPDGYFHQMQLQMECTGIDECDYVEMQFKELSYSEWVDCTAPFKSFFAVHEETNDVIYKDYLDTRDVPTWRSVVLGEKAMEYRIIYWMLNNWRSVTVKKDQQWLSRNLPSFETIWKEIQEYRSSGTFPQSPKEKATLVL
jgi:putative phage-type endonuclease